jgi:hypothetical protein
MFILDIKLHQLSTYWAALLTWFIRKPDDGPIGTETCSLPFIKYKYDVHDVNCFIVLVIKQEDRLQHIPVLTCYAPDRCQLKPGLFEVGSQDKI